LAAALNYTAGPWLKELEEQTIALLEPNSVNMNLTVRGRLKSQRVSKADTPDSAIYLIKWNENRSIGILDCWHADRIVVLSHGSVLEDGTHDSLFKIEDGHYKALVDAQLRECRLAKGVYPMVVLVCRDPCCDALRHVHIGDLLVEINGRDTAMMSVKKTVGFCENVHQDRLAQV
ncbi:hypothetical protein B5M09_013509, partial [Aphanomyces astaci]